MKTLVLTVLLGSAAMAADEAPLSGKWQVHSSIAGYENDLACTIAQKGNELSGSCTGEQGAVQISGKVAEKKVTWAYKSEYNGSPLTVSYSGTLSAENKISGSVRAEEYGVEGEFTATPVK